MLKHLFVNPAPRERAPEFAGRWLFPTAPLRFLVVASYVALAASTTWAGWFVWSRRVEFGDADGLVESVGWLEDASLWLVGALVFMQVSHAVWYIAQAWNARRCTLGVHGASGPAILFLAAPAIITADMIWVDDDVAFAVIAGFAVFVHMATWVLSFSLLSQMLRTLGHSTRRIAPWGMIVATHWVLLFSVRSVALVDDASVFAGLVLAAAVVAAASFLAAAVYAQLAMRDVERATRDFHQVRRWRTNHRHRRDRARRTVRAGVSPVAPPSLG